MHYFFDKQFDSTKDRHWDTELSGNILRPILRHMFPSCHVECSLMTFGAHVRIDGGESGIVFKARFSIANVLTQKRYVYAHAACAVCTNMFFTSFLFIFCGSWQNRKKIASIFSVFILFSLLFVVDFRMLSREREWERREKRSCCLIVNVPSECDKRFSSFSLLYYFFTIFWSRW